ncbi:MAG: DEAD/DEAH box helicase [Opitutaceae bacterium]
MTGPRESIDLFHPLIRKWFEEQVGRPTDVQEQAWPVIARGEHVLVTAPTGSGKTLTAFLWALNQFVSGSWETGTTRVLYISPLKALNNDIQRNLIAPLAAIREVFEGSGRPFPKIRVQTRSGDTSQSERRSMLRHPPEILITTPESLNLMLSSLGGRNLLTDLKTVILDEIHGVLDNRRGTFLITAVDRLVPLSGEFQRIALSATINPLGTVAAFAGGVVRRGTETLPRPVVCIESGIRKEYRLSVYFPELPERDEPDDSIWEPLVEEFKGIIERNRSTLFFVNNRRLCEKLALKINSGQASPLAYAHHGSLSREIREEVESRLKSGDLRAIVATNSLEMGIDIGALDEVVLVQSPPAISSAIQRIGRAGHQVGQPSRGTLFPTHARDFLEAAVLARQIARRDIEPRVPIEKPLDVLAQIILSMVAMEPWKMDSLHAFLRTSYPYRDLSRREFDLVINMLAGRYADTRLRELNPRVSIDRMEGTIRARKGALQALYFSGGVIPDRGYFHLRHDQTDSRLGELDEEFVWEARVGQVFTLGAQSWKIRRITNNDVYVLPAPPNAASIPFWISEDNFRDFHFSDAIGRFLEEAETELESPAFRERLQTEHSMNGVSADQLIETLRLQRKTTRQPLPHRHHLLVEHTATGPATKEGNQIILHTLWGGKLNRPFALALDAAWEERFHHRPEIFVNNDCIAVMVPIDVTAEEILSLVTSSRLEELIRRRLEDSGFFGARFRECAGRAMLINRSRPNQRVPLWMTRLRSQKLMESIRRFDDFPVLLETWRTCFRDEFDLGSLRQVLVELETGAITCSETRTASASPFGQSAAWRQVNQYMYSRDNPKGDRKSSLSTELLKELVFDPQSRPPIPEAIIQAFEAKRQRLVPGYGPDDGMELVDWLKERILLPDSEWKALRCAAPALEDTALEQKVFRVLPEGAGACLWVAAENAARLGEFYGGIPFRLVGMSEGDEPAIAPPGSTTANGQEGLRTRWLGEWLSFFGPITREEIRTTLGLSDSLLEASLTELIDADLLIEGCLIEGSEDVVFCDSANYEFLLRLRRAQATPPFEPLALSQLPVFLARQQGLLDRSEDLDGLAACLDRLLFLPAAVETWEEEILPARMQRYQPAFLDSILAEGELLWFGQGERKICFAYHQDMDLRAQATPSTTSEPASLEATISGKPHGLDFAALQEATALGAAALNRQIWADVWSSQIHNDGYSALRKGILNQFKLPKVGADGARRARHTRPIHSRRTQLKRMQGALPLAGRWSPLPQIEEAESVIDEEEIRKDRVRLLLDRYGLLFREILLRESEAFQWRSLFRTLRLMELSGELLSGYFFQELPGPQFTTPAGFRRLQNLGQADAAIFWLNATDPISPCGLELEGTKGNYPRRVPGNHLVFRGSELVLTSQRLGRDITFHLPFDDPDLVAVLEVFEHLLTRQFNPLARILVETINGEPAARSVTLDAFRARFDVVPDHRQVTLYRKYR